MRIFYAIIGFISLACGIIGIFLPLLPTTPFLLLSAFCFARSSEKFYAWLINHPQLGKTIKQWQEHKSINLKAKILAMMMIVLSMALSIFFNVPREALIAQAVILSLVSIFILTRPSGST